MKKEYNKTGAPLHAELGASPSTRWSPAVRAPASASRAKRWWSMHSAMAQQAIADRILGSPLQLPLQLESRDGPNLDCLLFEALTGLEPLALPSLV